ncbi:hypothetical protein NQZ68_000665 [Dissostichus eleginoides]|nr:hypothetical protein NQZ68_000665 [Dissostichus eleginoides]
MKKENSSVWNHYEEHAASSVIASAAPQKDRRSFAFLQRLVNMTLSSGAEKGVQSMSHLTGMSLTFSGWREQEES